MSKPVVQLFVVCAPGVDPATVADPEVSIVKLGWKFAQMDRGDLIDQVAQVDATLKALEKWVEGARGVLKQTLDKPEEIGEKVTPGKHFEAHYVKSIRNALDQEKSKAYFETQGMLKDYMKSTEVLTLRIIPIPQTPGVAA